MTAPPARLGFFKLNVPRMAPALAFWRQAFGFTVTMSFDEPGFIEHALALPGQEQSGPSLMLVCGKGGEAVPVGPGHGPVGLFCDDIAASFARAVKAGAEAVSDVFDAGGARVALLKSPDGHEIELVQLPG